LHCISCVKVKSEGKMANVALIPARSGSQRVRDKNIRDLAGKPLVYYTIHAAQEAGIFDEVIFVSDSARYVEIAKVFGAVSLGMRPKATAKSDSPDILWVRWVLKKLKIRHDIENLNLFILRPTSPLRTAVTINRAFSVFMSNYASVDSLRAVQPVSEHPGKMWVQRGQLLFPILPFETETGTPWHSSQKPVLPNVYVQNASLEIVKASVVSAYNSISGSRVLPFHTQGYEGFDLNEDIDFEFLEFLNHKESILTQGRQS